MKSVYNLEVEPLKNFNQVVCQEEFIVLLLGARHSSRYWSHIGGQEVYILMSKGVGK